MRTHTRRSKLDRLHAHTKAKRHARLRVRKDGSLGLDPEQEAGEAEDRAARYPVGYFGPQHGLTPAQAWIANQRLARANCLRPIRGRNAQQRYAVRIGGIISAVLCGRVGNSAFGRSLHGHRGGRVMAMHALHHLRAIAPLGRQAAQAAREGRKALKAWEQRQRQLASSPVEQLLEEWAQQEAWQGQQFPRSFMEW